MISTKTPEIQNALSLMEQGCGQGATSERLKGAVNYARGMYDKDWRPYLDNLEQLGFTGGRATLDVGSGAGHWSLALAQRNQLAVGIDLNEEYCCIARMVASQFENGHRTLFTKGSAERIPFPAEYFDFLICHGVLMFCEQGLSLSSFNRVLTQNGQAYLGCSGLGWYLSYFLVDGIIGGDQGQLGKGLTVLSDTFKQSAGFRHPERSWLAIASDEMSALAKCCGFRELSRPGIHDGMSDFLGVEAAWDILLTKVSDSRQLADDIELLLKQGSAPIAREVRHQTTVGNHRLALLILDAADEIGAAVDNGPLLRVMALLRAGHPDLAGAVLSGMSDTTPDTIYARAIHAHAKQNLGEAIKLYDRAGGSHDEATIGYLTAECYRELGRGDDAIHGYRDLIDHNPISLPPWIGLLGCLAEQRGMDEARATASEFIRARYETYNDKTEADELLSRLADTKPTTAPSNQLPSQPDHTDSDPLKGKKILLAPFEIAGYIGRITHLLRREHIDATSANYYDSWLQYECDINLNVSNMTPEDRNRAIDKFALEVIDKYDIYHFNFAHSLYPDLRDLPRLRDAGKHIIFSFWGSDRRALEWIFYQQARFLGHRPPRPYFLSRELYQKHKIINQYADVMLGATCIPRGLWIRPHADTSAWKLEDKERILKKKLITKDPNKTYFVHAPSNQYKKGSSMIVRLLKECQDEGMPIEVIFINQMPPEKARELYAYADYAVDQVGVGTFGLFGVEMMCWEIPVLVYQNELMNRLRDYPPVVPITHASFKSQIERCIQMKQSGERDDLGRRARKWAIETDDVKLALPEYLSIYRDLLRGKQIPQIVNRSWYDEEARMQAGFKSEFYGYMKEHKLFEAIGIKTPDYDRDLYF